MSENRSCPEFIQKHIGSLVIETYFRFQVNCANCLRWNQEMEKCREEIWVKEWVSK